MADASNNLGNNRNLVIAIQHIATGNYVSFKAFVKSFSDSFESSWNSEDVYGRMDPIQTFQGTKRIISVEWDVVAYDLDEAKRNLAKTDKLTNFLYPVYSDDKGATSISSAPLLRVKFSNLIAQPNALSHGTPDQGTAGTGIYTSGLVARMDGFRYEPDFDSGVFMTNGSNATLYPQTITIQGTFHILHTNKLGWRQTNGNLRHDEGGFPHGAQPPSLANVLDDAPANSTPATPAPPTPAISTASQATTLGAAAGPIDKGMITKFHVEGLDPNEDIPPPVNTIDPEDVLP